MGDHIYIVHHGIFSPWHKQVLNEYLLKKYMNIEQESLF